MSKAKKALAEIPDLEDIVTRWSKELFRMTATGDQKRLDLNCLRFNVNWRNVKTLFEEPNYQMMPFAGANPTAARTKPMQPQVLFTTHFSNSTDTDQEYSFKTERITRSIATIIIEQGYSRGMEFALKLKTPCEVVEGGAGFKAEMHVNNIGEDTIEEELIWGVDSQVKVPPRTETTAELLVSETQCSGSFVMSTQMKGRVVVTVTNLKQNNEIVTILEGELSEIILNAMQSKGTLKGFKVDGKVLTIETKGSCNFKFGVEQRVKIQSRPIAGGTIEFHNQKGFNSLSNYTNH